MKNSESISTSYLLPRIDQSVDTTSSYKLLTFMDAFSDYNQIWMMPEDEKKIAFIVDWDLFYCRIFDLSAPHK